MLRESVPECFQCSGALIFLQSVLRVAYRDMIYRDITCLEELFCKNALAFFVVPFLADSDVCWCSWSSWAAFVLFPAYTCISTLRTCLWKLDPHGPCPLKRSPSESGTGWRISWNSVECTQMSVAHNIGQLRQHAATRCNKHFWSNVALLSVSKKQGRNNAGSLQVHLVWIYMDLWKSQNKAFQKHR